VSSADQPADLSAEAITSVVRVHADRVHDAVRRLGCDQPTSVRVVEAAALELVDAAARRAPALDDPVGWFYARARALGRGSQTDDDALPVGGGVLGGDDAQVRLAEALESRPARDRAALLLRDSYQLPLRSVATVLGTDADTAAEVVGAARLAFLPALTGAAAPTPLQHVAPADLARLAEGGHPAAREAGSRRHVQGCERCSAVVDAQERARRLLTGLTVVALPDADRERVLAEVEGRAGDLLPASPPPEPDSDITWVEEPRRPYSLSLMALGLVAAVGAGLGLGAFLGRDGGITALGGQDPVPLVTPAPVITAEPPRTPSPTVSPSPRVFEVTPSPTPTPKATATPSATASLVPFALQLAPASGPQNSQITVSGQGWTPGAEVVVRFMNRVGNQAGATVTVTADEAGSFVVSLTAHDDNPGGIGEHNVVADDGTHTATATFTITP
jgi:DNA-directed RNA polymerase specialized sigma24 family protein